jgi:hypothetical protein
MHMLRLQTQTRGLVALEAQIRLLLLETQGTDEAVRFVTRDALPFLEWLVRLRHSLGHVFVTVAALSRLLEARAFLELGLGRGR